VSDCFARGRTVIGDEETCKKNTRIGKSTTVSSTPQHSIMRFATEEFARELLFGLIIRLEKTATENVSHWHQSGIFSVDV